jgi:hypothetical protein
MRLNILGIKLTIVSILVGWGLASISGNVPVPPEWAFTWLGWIGSILALSGVVLFGKSVSEGLNKFKDGMASMQRLPEIERTLRSIQSDLARINEQVASDGPRRGGE